MNDKTGRSSKLRLLLLFLMPGIIILTVVFEIQTKYKKKTEPIQMHQSSLIL